MKAWAIAALALVLCGNSRVTSASSCEDLAKLSLPQTEITLAKSVAPGNFSVDMGPDLPPGVQRVSVLKLPGFCRIAADIRPTADSDIKIEVWMPLSGWNGKFQGVGNDGWAGHMPPHQLQNETETLQGRAYLEMAGALLQGYATAGTDTGHIGTAGDASFALGHPEKVIDFAYRAVHEMTLKAKGIIADFYGKPAERAYWNGCSTGGKQGLMEAQRFPLDYDGIVAGAPANYWTHLMAGDIWLGQATHSTPASYIPQSKLALIHSATLNACDALDGVKDGVINNPLQCRFDPGVLLCKNEEQTDCLTAAQVEAARKIYAGPRNTRTGEQVFPGLEPGSENEWVAMAGGPEPVIVADYFKYLVFKNAAWDFRTLNFDQDIALSDQLNAKVLNATDPDLSAFLSHGGKLLLYHGWSDGLIAPENTVNYFNSVVSQLAPKKIDDSVRLFMIPGMGHCFGAEQFDEIGALDQWVQANKPPERINPAPPSGLARPAPRPLCPFPHVAQYIGKGSTDDPNKFVCAKTDLN